MCEETVLKFGGEKARESEKCETLHMIYIFKFKRGYAYEGPKIYRHTS